MSACRFFLVVNADQMFGATHLGDLNNTTMSVEDLRAHAIKLVKENPEWTSMATKTHMILVDCGTSKMAGGLGASHPHETIILTKPS